MANRIYHPAAERILSGQLDFSTGDYRFLLVDSSYTFNAAHEFVDDITGVIATSNPLTGLSVTNGNFDFDDVTFTTVSGPTGAALILRGPGASNASRPVIIYLDTNITGLPVTPGGNDVLLVISAQGLLGLRICGGS